MNSFDRRIIKPVEVISHGRAHGMFHLIVFFSLFAFFAFTGTYAAPELVSKDEAYIGEEKLIENEVSEREAFAVKSQQKNLRESILIQERLAVPTGGPRAKQRPDGIWCANSLARFELKAKDDLSGMHKIRYRVNDGAEIEYIEPFPILQEGRHQIVYYGHDNAGNRELQQVLPVLVDNTPPEVEINPVGNFKRKGKEFWAKPGFAIYSDGSDKLCGLQGVYVQKDGSTWQKVSAAGIEFPDAGVFNVKILADDFADNRSVPLEFVVKIDDTKPTVAARVKPDPVKDKESGELIFKDGSRIFVHPHDDVTEVDRILYRTSPDGEWLVLEGDNYLVPADKEDVYFETKVIDALGNESDTRVVKGRMLSAGKPIRTKINPIADEIRSKN